MLKSTIVKFIVYLVDVGHQFVYIYDSPHVPSIFICKISTLFVRHLV